MLKPAAGKLPGKAGRGLVLATNSALCPKSRRNRHCMLAGSCVRAVGHGGGTCFTQFAGLQEHPGLPNVEGGALGYGGCRRRQAAFP